MGNNRYARRRWVGRFVTTFGDAEHVELLDETTSERVDVRILDLLDQFLRELQRVLADVDQPLAVQRIE